MTVNVVDMFFHFLFSILGWMLEVSYRSVCAKRFVNPGLLKGPYLILYGAGALILMAAASLLQGSNWGIKAFAYFTVTTGLELVSGFIAQYLFKTRLWDYSDQPFNYKGYICLKFSLCWILLALAFEYVVLPPYKNMLNLLSPVCKWIFAGATISIMLVDFLSVSIGHFLRLTPEERTSMEAEFITTARPLLELPAVAKLAQYNHHRGKTRMNHVKEVAYLSFRWGKRLSLDTEAIIRGALLHDLFYYDWLHEGPRLHGFRHHNIALENARHITALTEKEVDIIKKHMWPLTIIPPRYMESLVVSLVDKFCSIRDYLGVKRKGKQAEAVTVCHYQEAGEVKK